MKRTILYAAAALLLGGCFKSVGYDTDVILKSWVQTESAAELKPAQGVVAYAFEADTVTWTVASYEDALNGVLTRKGTDEAGVSPVQGTAYRVDSVDMDLLLMRVGSTPVVVVAVDTENRLYGYRQQDLGENLPQLFTSVIFRPWKQMKNMSTARGGCSTTSMSRSPTIPAARPAARLVARLAVKRAAIRPVRRGRASTIGIYGDENKR